MRLIKNKANRDDILAFFEERMLPVDAVEAETLAEEVLRNPPEVGYLTSTGVVVQPSRASKNYGWDLPQLDYIRRLWCHAARLTMAGC